MKNKALLDVPGRPRLKAHSLKGDRKRQAQERPPVAPAAHWFENPSDKENAAASPPGASAYAGPSRDPPTMSAPEVSPAHRSRASGGSGP